MLPKDPAMYNIPLKSPDMLSPHSDLLAIMKIPSWLVLIVLGCGSRGGFPFFSFPHTAGLSTKKHSSPQ